MILIFVFLAYEIKKGRKPLSFNTQYDNPVERTPEYVL